MAWCGSRCRPMPHVRARGGNEAFTEHVRSLATMFTERLPDWLDAVRQDDLPSLRRWTRRRCRAP